MNKEEIKKILPHRDPILLVDRVIEKGDNYVIAERDIKENDPIFKGHFPDYPIYPGVYIIEGLAQTAGLLLLKSNEIPLFLGIDNARFKSEVKPNCVLKYVVKIKEQKASIVFVDAKAYVNDKLVAKAVLMLGSKR